MENTVYQQIRMEYDMKFCKLVQDLTIKRKKLQVNQNTMAVKCNVSIRKIQLFENFKSTDYFLVFAYRKLLC